jgi:HK97 family phage major capsid protein
VSTKFTRLENTAYLVGDGVNKPRGLLTYTTAATADSARAWSTFQHTLTGVNGAFGATTAAGDNLVDLMFSLKSDYRLQAQWMMSRLTLAAVRKLKDGDGNYLWQPNFAERTAGTLLGHGIVEAEDMPAIATGALSIAFGDYREAYTIVDREGIRVLRDPFTAKPYTHFYTTKRTGGAAINFDAVKFLKFSA